MWERLFARYPADCQPIAPPVRLGGGFSGAQVWHAETPSGPVVIRRHAEHFPSASRLEWLHRSLQRLDQLGWHDATPLPRRTTDGATWVACNDRLWEIVERLPGDASWVSRRSEKQLHEAIQALARFHHLASALQELPPGTERTRQAPVVSRRIEWLGQHRARARRLSTAAGRLRDPEMAETASAVLERFRDTNDRIVSELRRLGSDRWPRQIVLRDLRADDVFFDHGAFVGFVDLTALGYDAPVADVVRLAGTLSWPGLRWSAVIASYETLRPFGDIEPSDLCLLDEATQLCAMMNWLQWSLLERRSFAPLDVAFGRLRDLATRPPIAA